MKRFMLIALTMTLFVTAAMGADFRGSKQSDKFHLPTCKWARKITRENLVLFASAEEATQAGYKSCRVCRPAGDRVLPPKPDNSRNEALDREEQVK